MDNSKPIPEAVWATLISLNQDRAVKEAVEIERRSGGQSLAISVEYDDNGHFIVCFYEHDLWMLQHPSGEWEQCFVGHDAEYSRDVLERKYGLRNIFSAHLKSFERVCPVYTK